MDGTQNRRDDRRIIDCDVHPPTPSTAELLPYLDPHWQEVVVGRGVDELLLSDYPPGAPLSCRSDFRPVRDVAPTALDRMRDQLLGPFSIGRAILNPLHGAPALHSEDLAAAFCRAVNAWIAAEWLNRDDRLRASILVPVGNAELAVEEIERWAGDPRFVQVLLLAGGDAPLGRRLHWPIYVAAQRHGLPVGIHLGSALRHAPTGNGWTTYLIEDHVVYAQTFQSQLLSLIGEGVFSKFPDLRVVLIESGFTWLPSFLWRAVKEWRALRREVPWVDRSPAEILRSSIRFTLQPTDAPPTAEQMTRTIDQIGSEEVLLFSTDYPHWRFDGAAAIPDGFTPSLTQRLQTRNPLATYPRLRETWS